MLVTTLGGDRVDQCQDQPSYSARIGGQLDMYNTYAVAQAINRQVKCMPCEVSLCLSGQKLVYL